MERGRAQLSPLKPVSRVTKGAGDASNPHAPVVHRGPETHSLVGRYYDPTTGQFLSVDPLVDETGEAYVYTGDDPVNSTDPDGTRPRPPHPGPFGPFIEIQPIPNSVSSGGDTLTSIKVGARAEPYHPDWVAEVTVQVLRNGEPFWETTKPYHVGLDTIWFPIDLVTPPGDYTVTAEMEAFVGPPIEASPQEFSVTEGKKNPSPVWTQIPSGPVLQPQAIGLDSWVSDTCPPQ